MTNRAKEHAQTRDQRGHRRLPMTVPVSMELDGTGDPLTVQNRDISWGGVRFAVAREAMRGAESVTMRFPWTKGNQFSAEAKILRKESLDDEHDLVAARFSSLTTADERRLEKLLQLLQYPGEADSEEQAPLVPILEVLIADAEEMRQKLTELADGRLSVTVFEAYAVNQSIRLILGEVNDQPPLRLRARVAEVVPNTAQGGSSWSVFDVRLQFEHPIEELRAAAASLAQRLSQRPTTPDQPAGATTSVDSEYAYH